MQAAWPLASIADWAWHDMAGQGTAGHDMECYLHNQPWHDAVKPYMPAPVPRCRRCPAPGGRAPPRRHAPPLCSPPRLAHPLGRLGQCSCALRGDMAGMWSGWLPGGMHGCMRMAWQRRAGAGAGAQAAHRRAQHGRLRAASLTAVISSRAAAACTPKPAPGHVMGRHACLASRQDAGGQVQGVGIRLAAGCHVAAGCSEGDSGVADGGRNGGVRGCECTFPLTWVRS